MLRRLRKAAFMKPFLVGEDDVMIQFVCQACTESTFAKSESDFETPRVTTYGQKNRSTGPSSSSSTDKTSSLGGETEIRFS